MEWPFVSRGAKSNEPGSSIPTRRLAWLLPAMILLASAIASSQEIPRPSTARQRQPPPSPGDSNIKVGELFLTAEVALSAEYIDNINLSSIDPLSDFVITPELGIAASWRATELNALRFRSAFSFERHLEHRQFDQQNLTIAPDSALSFKFYTGDVRIDLHDYFSLKNETRDEASLSGISSLPRFENTAGISVLWDLNNVTWSLGYDHYNFITLGSALLGDGTEEIDASILDHSTDSVSTSVLIRIHSALRAGLEATATYTDYPEDSVNDFATFTLGPFAEVQLTRYTSAFASIGFKTYELNPAESPMNTTPGGQDDRKTGYYANFGIVHQLNRFYTDRLDFGHEDEVDALSGRTQTNYIRYSARWAAGRRISMSGQLSFDDIRQDSRSLIGATDSSNYLKYGAALSVSYYLSNSSSISVIYQFTKQDSDFPISTYEQNRISLRLSHRF